MAISTKGVLEWTLYEKGGSDHLRLIEFLGKVIKNKKNKLILMDNANCHRNQEVKYYITNKKNNLKKENNITEFCNGFFSELIDKYYFSQLPSKSVIQSTSLYKYLKYKNKYLELKSKLNEI